MRLLNSKWHDDGRCIRLQQWARGPTALSDLIFASAGTGTYSIEVKKIQGKQTKLGGEVIMLTRSLSFSHDFSIATGPNEKIPHQLERQVLLCRRMGWHALILLYVPIPGIRVDKYLFHSEDIYAYWKAGHASMPAAMFAQLHDDPLYKELTRTTAKAKVTDIEAKKKKTKTRTRTTRKKG